MHDASRAASKSGRHTALALLLLLTLAAATLPAQQGTFSDTVAVELVEVDALVTDREGRPVLDLTVEDFRLFDDGEPVTVTHFAPPGAAAAPVSGGPAEPGFEIGTLASGPATAPRIVIFLDEVHLTLRSRHLAFDRIQEVLDGELPAGTEVLLASYSGSVEVLAPFGSSRKQLTKRLAERLSSASQATANRFETASLMRQLPELVKLALAPPDYMESACSTVSGFVRGQAQQAMSRVEASIAALGQFVRSLAVYPGPKSLLYVSDGLPMVAGQELYDYLIEICDGSLLNMSADPELRELATYGPATRFPTAARSEMAELSTARLWNELAAEANTRRVTLNSIQASGLETGGRAGVDGARASSVTESFGQRNRQEPLVVMAEETGGEAIFNTNNVAPAVEELIELESARYVLAFTPLRPDDGDTHELRLEVADPDLRVRYRRSYKRRSPDEQVADGVLASLHHGLERNPHGVRIVARRLDDREAAVETRVPLGSLVLLPDEDGTRGLFTLFIAALDKSGVGTSLRKKSVTLNLRPDEAGGIHTVSTSIDLRGSREYVVAVAVRDELSGSTSFTTTRLPAN